MIVYIYTFPNGKRYVGQTCQSLERRAQNGNGYKECPAIWRAIQKYGWENIQKEIIECSSEEEMDIFEQFYIEEFDTMNPEHGYNLESGGHIGKHLSEETKQKLREMRLDTTLSEETKQKISKSLLEYYQSENGEETKQKISRSLKEYYQTEEGCLKKQKIKEDSLNRWADPSFKEKMSEAHTGEKNGMFGRKHSEETKERMRKNSKTAKRVRCIETGIIYPSAAEAARQTKACDSAIRNTCNGRAKTSGGFHWEWAE